MSTGGKYLYHLCRIILALTFLYAGVIKALDTIGFAGQVANYRLFPYAWNYLIAAVLPYLEMLCGLLLLLNRRVRPALLVLLVLNLVFIAALSSALLRGLDIDCGCFNPAAEHPTSPLAALLRDLVLLLMMGCCWHFQCRVQSRKGE